MCRVVPYAAAGEEVHALADCQVPFHLVGEQGKVRIQVHASHTHKLDSLRRSWLARRGKKCSFVRLVVCLVSRRGEDTPRKPNGKQYCSNDTKNKRTKCQSHHLFLRLFPFPLLSLFLPILRHTPALRSLLSCKSTWNQFDQSCSSLVSCATLRSEADEDETRIQQTLQS